MRRTKKQRSQETQNMFITIRSFNVNVLQIAHDDDGTVRLGANQSLDGAEEDT